MEYEQGEGQLREGERESPQADSLLGVEPSVETGIEPNVDLHLGSSRVLVSAQSHNPEILT